VPGSYFKKVQHEKIIGYRKMSAMLSLSRAMGKNKKQMWPNGQGNMV
jgi:hypothetical protein